MLIDPEPYILRMDPNLLKIVSTTEDLRGNPRGESVSAIVALKRYRDGTF